MTKPERIFVMGHMGAGKAQLAEALAQKLGWHYIDANPSLERYIGRNLKDILGEQGEEAFHRCEHEILLHYKSQKQIVMVLEEAVICTEENRRLLAAEYVIFLKVSIPTQIERMQTGRTPLLPIDNMHAFLEQQHVARDHLFDEVASLTIESISVDSDVDKIIEAIQ